MLTLPTLSERLSGATRDLLAGVFEHNLEAAGLLTRTRELVRNSPPTGRIAYLPNGVPVSDRDGLILGAPSAGLRAPNNEGAIVVFGLGVGHTVRELRSRAAGSIVVYEPDPGIVRALFECGPTDLGDVDIVCTLGELREMWTRLARGNVDATLIKTPGYSQAFPDEQRELTETVTRLVSRVGINSNTYRVRSRVWIQDVLDNLDYLCDAPLFQALSGRFKNVPAFIVGAGPSLGKNGELLADAQKKGIVFAVNSSGRALASYGVEPQVLACMESIDVSHLIADLPFIDRVVRAFTLTANPKTFATGKGPLLPMYEALPEVAPSLEQLTGQQGLSVCASISTVAFSLAQRLGCSPIVLVGQDLAYTDGKAYARGTPYEHSRVRLDGDKRELELDWDETLKSTHERAQSVMRTREQLDEIRAWGGQGTVWSGAGFSPIRLWFDEAAHILKASRPETQLVNATEGGAHIGGFEEIALADVLAPLPELGITAQTIMDAAAQCRAPLDPQQLKAWVEEQIGLTRAIASSALRMRRINERAQRAMLGENPVRVRKTFAALSLAEAELKKAIQRSRIVEAWCFAEFEAEKRRNTELETPGSVEGDAVNALRYGAQLATIIEDSARELEQLFAQVAQRLGAKAERNPACPS